MACVRFHFMISCWMCLPPFFENFKMSLYGKQCYSLCLQVVHKNDELFIFQSNVWDGSIPCHPDSDRHEL